MARQTSRLKWLVLPLIGVIMGCSSVRPAHLTVAYVHQSQPMVGPWPAPFGDHGRTEETNLDGIELGAGWERGRWFGDLGLLYGAHRTNVAGGPWVVTGRVGVKVWEAK